MSFRHSQILQIFEIIGSWVCGPIVGPVVAFEPVFVAPIGVVLYAAVKFKSSEIENFLLP